MIVTCKCGSDTFLERDIHSTHPDYECAACGLAWVVKTR